MNKKDKKPAPTSKDPKKVEEKPKLNYEELILKNLAEPRISLDRTGYHFTVLDLSVKSYYSQNFSFHIIRKNNLTLFKHLLEISRHYNA